MEYSLFWNKRTCMYGFFFICFIMCSKCVFFLYLLMEKDNIYGELLMYPAHRKREKEEFTVYNLNITPARPTRKFAARLVDACPHDTRFGVVSCGNHEVRDLPREEVYVHSDDGQRDVLVRGNRAFSYHGTVIAVAADAFKVLTVTSAGWGSMSTNAAINQYIGHFKWLGYKIVVAN